LLKNAIFYSFCKYTRFSHKKFAFLPFSIAFLNQKLQFYETGLAAPIGAAGGNFRKIAFFRAKNSHFLYRILTKNCNFQLKMGSPAVPKGPTWEIFRKTLLLHQKFAFFPYYPSPNPIFREYHGSVTVTVITVKL
jgi:hypothetical protein